MDEFSMLLALTHAAESCNGAARQFIEDYRDVPEWSHFRDGTLCQPTADSQAAQCRGYIRSYADGLKDYIHKWDAAYGGLRYISEAVITMQPWPVFDVNGRTYSTAHEAARAAAEWMVEIYRRSEGWNDMGFIADIARHLGGISPKDFSGYIEREHYAASPLAPLDPELMPNEARAKFCFEEWQSGKTLKEINVALKRNPEWEHFDDERKVRGPINSWADRIGRKPRKGQPGRRAKA